MAPVKQGPADISKGNLLKLVEDMWTIDQTLCFYMKSLTSIPSGGPIGIDGMIAALPGRKDCEDGRQAVCLAQLCYSCSSAASEQ